MVTSKKIKKVKNPGFWIKVYNLILKIGKNFVNWVNYQNKNQDKVCHNWIKVIRIRNVN